MKKKVITKKLSEGKPTYEKLIENVGLLKMKIRIVMRRHIGEENFITPVELFKCVYAKDPMKVEYYKRYFLWNVIKKTITNMRKEDEIYIINKSRYLFVLKSEKEYDNHHKFLERNIKGIKQSQRRARDWVLNEKWRNL